ncbi:centromere protein Chl4/mis15/CENP-N [Pilobolus umbonatus]|nr:centromere protein Chl4/mis15/CENP-N [Pilobolus umbonatus]
MFDTTKRTKWKVIKMGKVNGTIDLNLSIDTIRHKLEMFLNRIFHTYVYGFHHKQTNGYWFRVCCYKNNEAHKLPPASHRGFLVYYPQTNYLVIQSYWLKEIMTYLNEAILHVFSADKLTITKITCNKLDEMSDVILNRNSLGVFSQLRNNQVDANPLDIRQKKPEGHDQTYVKTAEQRRRIVPIDPEQMKARYDMLSDHFGWDTIRSSGALDIDLLLPLHTGPETVSNADEELHIEIQMKGTSVMEGVRKMLLNGQIEASPGWVAGAATSGATKIYISKEGISSAIDTDDEENGENEVPAEVMTG